jgi:hypothetical protein
MDKNIIIAAHHEAGHALMAYIVGWTISSIELNVQSNILNFAITQYDFGNDINNNEINLKRRILCLMGGPISQALFQDNYKIDLDTLEQDGVTIDNLLTHIDILTKEDIIQSSINTTATLLNFKDNINARNQITEILIKRHGIMQNDFHQIMISNNVKRMDFNQ